MSDVTDITPDHSPVSLARDMLKAAEERRVVVGAPTYLPARTEDLNTIAPGSLPRIWFGR